MPPGAGDSESVPLRNQSLPASASEPDYSTLPESVQIRQGAGIGAIPSSPYGYTIWTRGRP